MNRGPNYCAMNRGWLRAMKRAERAAKKARAVRLARRDLEYAAAHVPVTVEERGGIVVETRGRCCVAPQVTHLESC